MNPLRTLAIAGTAAVLGFYVGSCPIPDGPSIGATPVPNLHCAEDEAISFVPETPVPAGGYRLGCVQVDVLRKQLDAEAAADD